MRILILYDNVARPPLREGWGFSALIEVQDRKILFDAGADRLVLEHNVEKLGVDLSQLTDVFLSHPHCDHVGGLSYVLEEAKGVRIWAPWVMEGYLRPRAAKAELILVKGPRRLGEGLWSTGTMGRRVKEHGFVIATEEGPVLVTGCAHPGIARMAARAARIAGGRLALVLGGFHLAGTPEGKLAEVIRDLRETTSSVAPGHCTGDGPTAALLAAFPGARELSVGFALVLPD
ncbi:MAG: Putative metal-dependent hydrolase [Acetothermia bacterium 64_32]|nr:MAG: Putative metal-dependent hydrolase [Acetothermia bacterium 64_32]HAF70277.1 MBL fold metallo-hydrolase [Candidatus Acetothermia bacterium]